KLVQVPGETTTDNKQIIGGFPIYHKGEATVNKIPTWKEIFNKNEELLKHKYKKPTKLNLGCGDLILKGFINIDLYSDKAQLKCNGKYLPFKDNSIDEIYASHLIEHFDFKEGFDVLKEWLRVLKVEGKLIIETPDLLESAKKFIEANEQERINFYSHFFSEPWIDGQWHKFLYTYTQLKWTLEQVGFRSIEKIPALRYIGREDICLGMKAIK
ncbi:MAG: methyltransferase domain-containing protein, partial [Patescibacteria group bacterium]